MAVIAMMLASVTALVSTVFFHLVIGLNFGQAVTVYFGTGMMTILMCLVIARVSFLPTKAAHLAD